MPRGIKKEIDEKTVYTLAYHGASAEEIGDCFEVCGRTIRNRFSKILTKGDSDGKQDLRRKQQEKAMDGNVTMLIWLGKQRLGQAEKTESKVEQKDVTVTLEGVYGA
jgi:hypothetical protein